MSIWYSETEVKYILLKGVVWLLLLLSVIIYSEKCGLPTNSQTSIWPFCESKSASLAFYSLPSNISFHLFLFLNSLVSSFIFIVSQSVVIILRFRYSNPWFFPVAVFFPPPPLYFASLFLFYYKFEIVILILIYLQINLKFYK